MKIFYSNQLIYFFHFLRENFKDKNNVSVSKKIISHFCRLFKDWLVDILKLNLKDFKKFEKSIVCMYFREVVFSYTNTRLNAIHEAFKVILIVPKLGNILKVAKFFNTIMK